VLVIAAEAILWVEFIMFRSRSMRTYVTALAQFLFLAALIPTAQAQRAIIVVRHADKETDPKILSGLSDEEIPLSLSGRIRARTLADVLRDSGVKAIYTSTALRTKQTAKPLADDLGINPEVLDTSTDALADLGETLRTRHGHDVVLIVGHSDTVRQIIDRLMGRRSGIEIGDNQYDRLFVLVPKADGTWGLIRSNY
jgi:broad specificity phosphatase PhoE